MKSARLLAVLAVAVPALALAAVATGQGSKAASRARAAAPSPGTPGGYSVLNAAPAALPPAVAGSSLLAQFGAVVAEARISGMDRSGVTLYLVPTKDASMCLVADAHDGGYRASCAEAATLTANGSKLDMSFDVAGRGFFYVGARPDGVASVALAGGGTTSVTENTYVSTAPPAPHP